MMAKGGVLIPFLVTTGNAGGKVVLH